MQGATPDQQVEHYLKEFVGAVDAHWRSTNSDQKRSTRNIKAGIEVALVKAYKERGPKTPP